jgi:hypothetical protein
LTFLGQSRFGFGNTEVQNPVSSTRAVHTGRLMVLVAMVVTLGSDLIVSLIGSFYLPRVVIIGSVIRWLLTAALFYAIWHGRAWARWLTVALLGLGLILVLPEAVSTHHLLLVGVALQFIISVALLTVPRSVGAFLTSQRERYTLSTS